MMDMFSLKGKKTFVSDANRDLGREMAFTLAEGGADIALASRDIVALN